MRWLSFALNLFRDMLLGISFLPAVPIRCDTHSLRLATQIPQSGMQTLRVRPLRAKKKNTTFAVSSAVLSYCREMLLGGAVWYLVPLSTRRYVSASRRRYRRAVCEPSGFVP